MLSCVLFVIGVVAGGIVGYLIGACVKMEE